MLERLQALWREFTRGTPGRRFQERFERSHRRSRRTRWTTRIIRVILAALAIAVGLVLAVLPGPAVLFFLAAGMLLAAEWLWVAKFLDWLEVRVRRLGRFALKAWHQLSSPARVALIALGVMIGSVTTWSLYQFVR